MEMKRGTYVYDAHAPDQIRLEIHWKCAFVMLIYENPDIHATHFACSSIVFYV